MYGTNRNGVTQFMVKPPAQAKKVALAGSHTNWTPVAMKRQADGTFVAKAGLNPGTYEYKFIIDGAWCTDPDNQMLVPNPFGTGNSLAVIPPKSAQA